MPSPVYRSLADGICSSPLTPRGFLEGKVLGPPLNLNYNRSLLTCQFGYDFFFLVNTSMFCFILFIYLFGLSLIDPLGCGLFSKKKFF